MHQVDWDDMSNQNFRIGDWVWHTRLKQPVKILSINENWGFNTFEVWSENLKKSIISKFEDVVKLSESTLSKSNLMFIISAAKILDAYSNEKILSPVESKIIPLPHQVNVLSTVMKSGGNIRFLLSDEVGLGKTIEAGLIIKELKIRGQANRVLILTPKGLIIQWIQEMNEKFNEKFQFIEPSEFMAFEDNIWTRYDQIITSIDSVKPLDKRKGWSKEKIEQFNQKRFDNLISAKWDLIIIDESHKLGGTDSSVARYKLGKAISEISPNLLLLSATPHQGNREQFHRLISLLDKKVFPDPSYVSQESVKPYVIRTEKRTVIDSSGKLLFTKRTTNLLTMKWGPSHQNQRKLYEDVTDYALNGYNQAKRENRQHMALLMILMQRLVSSSTHAIRSALEKRLEILKDEYSKKEEALDEELIEEDSQNQLEQIISEGLGPLDNEKQTVEELLILAKTCELEGSDTKTEFLYDLLIKLQQSENDPKLKFLIFTEFTATQKMLQDYLSPRGYSITVLNGSMNLTQRNLAQKEFREKSQIMISTEAGGEGLNLQFCHIVINYDLPWNPMRIEQRIGRIDRIGQKTPVIANNLSLDETVETRVRQVLENKLQIILSDIGVDKLSDVLDSSEIDMNFNELYLDAMSNPNRLNEIIESFLKTLKNNLDETNRESVIKPQTHLDAKLAEQLKEHHLPLWTQIMVSNHLQEFGGRISENKKGFDIKWSDGTVDLNVTFFKDKIEQSSLNYISLENSKVRKLLEHLGIFVRGQKIQKVMLKDLDFNIKGTWSLWKVGIFGNNKIMKIFPLFISDDGKILKPTATFVWDLLLQNSEFTISDSISSELDFEKSHYSASEQGKQIFSNLQKEFENNTVKEQQKMDSFFSYQREVTNKIALENVRKKRLTDIDLEEQKFQDQINQIKQINPEFNPLIILQVQGEKHE